MMKIRRAAGRDAAYGGGEPVSVEGGGNLALGHLQTEFKARKGLLEDGVLHDPGKVARKAPCQLVVVTGAKNPLLRGSGP